MKKLFSYQRNNEDEIFNGLVDSALELAMSKYSGKELPDYQEKNKMLLEGIGRKIVEGTKYEAQFDSKKMGVFSSQMLKNTQSFKENFNSIISEICTAIVPTVTNDTFENYIAEIRQIGYGDTAVFDIESNDLFKANSKAEGVVKGIDQPMFDTEMTVNTKPIEISAYIDWYPFVSGTFDMGNFALKIARSFAGYIFLKAIKGMTSASTQFGNAFSANGVDPVTFGELKQAVMGANGGMNVVAIGTEIAVSNLSLNGNYQVAVGEEMNKVGYLNQYLGVPIVALSNAIVPGTTNTTATAALPNDIIYLVPAAGQRPVKIVFEGNETTVTCDPDNSSDKRYGIRVEMRVGISAVCGAKYGTINL